MNKSNIGKRMKTLEDKIQLENDTLRREAVILVLNELIVQICEIFKEVNELPDEQERIDQFVARVYALAETQLKGIIWS